MHASKNFLFSECRQKVCQHPLEFARNLTLSGRTGPMVESDQSATLKDEKSTLNGIIMILLDFPKLQGKIDRIKTYRYT